MARVLDVPFVKGHGTENDFVLLPDLEGTLELTAERVRWLCDRRRGIGADGVLRVVRCARDLEFSGYADVAEFFMDHRNADGSLAEMCGNGARVFVRYLHATGALSSRTTVIATRAGLIEAEVRGAEAQEIVIGMGTIQDSPQPLPITVTVAGAERGTQGGTSSGWDAIAAYAPNPHAVVFVDDLDAVGALGGLDDAPIVSPPEAFPEGVNIEFVERLGPEHIRMRVYERGVGETRSCGTGACAAAWVAATMAPASGDTYRVDVPGGSVYVDFEADGRIQLRGPAELIARGTFQWPRGL